MRFNEDHREIITRTQIAKKLKKDGTHGAIVLFAIMMIFFIVPFSFLMAVLQIKELTIVGSVIVALASALTIYAVFRAISITSIVNSGRYTITEDKFFSLTKHTYYRRRVEHREYIFFFESGKEYTVTDPIANDETRIVFSITHSNPGDTFYLVTFDKDPTKPVLIYSGVLFKLEQR